MARYDLVQGDLEQPIGAILADPDDTGGLPVDATVTFAMSQAHGVKRVTGTAVVDDRATRTVHYQWLTGDTSVPGVYRAQWTVHYAGGSSESFPSDEPFYVIVHPAV